MDRVLVLLCMCILHLAHAEKDLAIALFWVHGENGVDNSTCGTATAPCRTLCYVVNVVNQGNNISYVEVNLQSSLYNENCGIPLALTIQINGNENSIKGSTISLPKVNYMNTWIDSSKLSGQIFSFDHCTITESMISGAVKQGDQDQPELTLAWCRITDSNITFHNLNISNTALSNSPLASPADGKCDVIGSNFTGTVGAAALTCGSSSIRNSIFSENKGVLGGAINAIVFAYIGYSSISGNNAVYGGGIYSQGIVFLDNVEISNNNASQGGGGIYFYGPQTNLQCVDTVYIQNNNAQIGAGIAINSEGFSANTEVPGQLCIVQNNVANAAGGGVYVNGSSANMAYFRISDNFGSHGAGIFSVASSLFLRAITAKGNVGGGMRAVDSAVVLTLSMFSNNTGVNGILDLEDVRLHNSSSRLQHWTRVSLSSVKSFSCDDCAAKLCSAGSSCSDCGRSCIIMGHQAVCVENQFDCVHGICDLMKDQNPQCKCDPDFTGDLCESKKPLPSQWENVLFIVAFGVGCAITTGLVVAFIVRLHRRRAGYLPLLK